VTCQGPVGSQTLAAHSSNTTNFLTLWSSFFVTWCRGTRRRERDRSQSRGGGWPAAAA
jgi:hypothetical protein